jgi:hypothetical protein
VSFPFFKEEVSALDEDMAARLWEATEALVGPFAI